MKRASSTLGGKSPFSPAAGTANGAETGAVNQTSAETIALAEADSQPYWWDVVYFFLGVVWCASLKLSNSQQKAGNDEHQKIVSVDKLRDRVRVWIFRLGLVLIALCIFFGTYFSTEITRKLYLQSYANYRVEFQSITSISIEDCFLQIEPCDARNTDGFQTFNVEVLSGTKGATVLNNFKGLAGWSGSCMLFLCMTPEELNRGGQLIISTQHSTVAIRNLLGHWNVSITSASETDASRLILTGLLSTMVNVAAAVVIINELPHNSFASINNRFGPVYVLGKISDKVLIPNIKTNLSYPSCIDPSFYDNSEDLTYNSTVVIHSASSLYLHLPNSSAETLIDTLNMTNTTLSPKVMSVLNDTTQWIAGFANPQYIQKIEVIGPMIGFALLNSNRALIFEFGPTLLTFVTFYKLSPTYRFTPMSHYGCFPIYNFDRVGSLTDTFTQLTADEMTQVFPNAYNLADVYTIITAVQSQQTRIGVATTTTVYVPLDGSYENSNYYDVSRVFDHYDQKKVEANGVGLIVVLISAVVSVLIVGILCFALWSVREEIVKVIFRHKLRKRNRAVATDEIGLCDYSPVFGYSFLSGWAAFYITQILEKLYYSQQESTEACVKQFALAFVHRSDNDMIPMSTFLHHMKIFASLTFCSVGRVTDTAYVAQCIAKCEHPESRGFPKCKFDTGEDDVSFVSGISHKVNDKQDDGIFNGCFAMTSNPLDDVPVTEVVQESHLDENAVLAEAEQRGLHVIRRRVIVIRKAVLIPLTGEQINDVTRLTEYNCSGLPILYQLRNDAADRAERQQTSAIVDCSFVKIKRAFVYIAPQALIYVALEIIPVFFVGWVLVSIRVESLKYTCSHSDFDLGRVHWVLFLPGTVTDAKWNIVPIIFVAVCVVFIFEPALLAIFRALTNCLRNISPLFADLLDIFSLIVRLSTLAAAGLIIFAEYCWFFLVLQWWVLGAIIAPNVMLPFATASFTFIVSGVTIAHSLRKNREEVVSRLEHYAVTKLVEKLKSCPVHLPFGSDGSESVSSLSIVSQININLLEDLRELKPDALQKFSSISGVPLEFVDFSVRVGMKDRSEGFERSVGGILARLQFLDDFKPFVQLVAVTFLGAPASPALLGTCVDKIAPAPMRPYFRCFDPFIRTLVPILASRLRASSSELPNSLAFKTVSSRDSSWKH